MAFVVELQDRAGNRDPTLLFDFHPVGNGVLGRLPGLDGTGQVDGASVEQQFFSQRRLTGIGVRDDGKSTAIIYFID